jgi:hypothetical protein
VLDAGHEVPCNPERDAGNVTWKIFEDHPVANARRCHTPDTAFLPRLAGHSFLMGLACRCVATWCRCSSTW